MYLLGLNVLKEDAIIATGALKQVVERALYALILPRDDADAYPATTNTVDILITLCHLISNKYSIFK
jgi:hypothetical protein